MPRSRCSNGMVGTSTSYRRVGGVAGVRIVRHRNLLETQWQQEWVQAGGWSRGDASGRGRGEAGGELGRGRGAERGRVGRGQPVFWRAGRAARGTFVVDRCVVGYLGMW